MDFLIKELDLDFSITELIEYYKTLENSYQHLCWKEASADAIDADLHKITGLYGWGIQSNLLDLTRPCPPYHVHKDSTGNYRDTELMFGFAEKIKQAFPYSHQHSISAHPPGTEISLHTDSPGYLKIHMPITNNDNSYFVFEEKKFILKAGCAYLINTTKLHGTYNDGNDTRVHLFFKIPADHVDTVLKVKSL